MMLMISKSLKVKCCAMVVLWMLATVCGAAGLAAPQTMVLVEGGTYLMGAAPRGVISSEQPVRQVTVTSFYMSKYEVTFAEFDEFCQDTGRAKPKDNWGRDRRPVVGVTWQDAVEFGNWLSRKEGLTPAYQERDHQMFCDFSASGYRLPTEAEWEYAAKGGVLSQGYKYSGGNDINDVAWCENNSGNKTQPVGQKRPNELGLYDMSGNAWEWCWDWYDRDYAQGDASNPTGHQSGKFRTIRGGSMNFFACSPAYRFYYPVSARITYIGFRLARSYL